MEPDRWYTLGRRHRAMVRRDGRVVVQTLDQGAQPRGPLRDPGEVELSPSEARKLLMVVASVETQALGEALALRRRSS